MVSREVVWDPPGRSGAEFCRRVATPIATRAGQALSVPCVRLTIIGQRCRELGDSLQHLPR